MSDSTRRGFLKVAGASVAAASVAAAVPTALSRHESKPEVAAAKLPAAASGSMVAYITDVKTGQLAVMVEGREVNITDHDLVARLATHLHANPAV